MNCKLSLKYVFFTFYLWVNLSTACAANSNNVDDTSVLTEENGILLEINNPQTAKEKERATLIRLLYASVSTKNSKYNSLKTDALEILSTYPRTKAKTKTKMKTREALFNKALQELEAIGDTIAAGKFSDVCKIHQCEYQDEVGYVQSPSDLFGYSSTGNIFASQTLFDTITAP